MPVPTRRFVIVVLVTALALLVSPFGTWFAFWVVDLLLLLLLVADWAAAVRPARITVVRELPGALAMNGTGTVGWTVGNPTTRPVVVGVADELPPSWQAPRRRFQVDLPAASVASVSVPIRPTRRGRFTPTAVTVRVRGPLGLAARQATRALPGEMRVLPSFPSRDEAELRINRARVLDVGLRSARGRGGGTEFEQLREYTADDEFRRIDWSATARLDRPSCAPIGPSATNTCSCCSTTAGRWRRRWRACRVWSTPWTRR